MKTTLAIGRLALGFIFLFSGVSKILNYDATLQLMATQGLPAGPLLLPMATATEMIGAILLIIGSRVEWVSVILAVYLIPVTLTFHRFWELSGGARQTQIIHFLKNLSIMGGLTLTYAYQRILNSFTAGTLTTIRRESYQRRKAG